MIRPLRDNPLFKIINDIVQIHFAGIIQLLDSEVAAPWQGLLVPLLHGRRVDVRVREVERRLVVQGFDEVVQFLAAAVGGLRECHCV